MMVNISFFIDFISLNVEKEIVVLNKGKL